MTFKKLSPTEWDAEREPFDFRIRLERDEYVVDVFDSKIKNPDDAYQTTHTCDTWEQVERSCRDYNGKTVVSVSTGSPPADAVPLHVPGTPDT